MKKTLLSMIIFMVVGISTSRAQLITNTGTHVFQDHSVSITISGAKPEELNFTLSFDLPEFKGQTGNGKGQFLKMIPGKWAAQFVAPNQLWIYDGLGEVYLYERTQNPRGFKGSQSSIVPSLMVEAPKELKAVISKSETPEEQAPKK